MDEIPSNSQGLTLISHQFYTAVTPLTSMELLLTWNGLLES